MNRITEVNWDNSLNAETTLERATRLVNGWTSQCLSLAPNQQGILLIQMIADALDEAKRDIHSEGVP